VSSLYAVVPAAGVGSRMQADRPKQYLNISDKTILEHTLERLLAFDYFEKIIVSISAEDEYWPELNLNNHPKIEVCSGGKERYDSVLNGLNHLRGMGLNDNVWVMVHDAARPCITPADLDALYQSKNSHGSLLGLQVRDTMKRTDAEGNVIKTVDRNNLWHALTPQMATLGVLYEAITQCLTNNVNITDEASALEYIGLSPKMISGDPSNIKVTRPDDLALADSYLNQALKESAHV
jgi:2-C-methyl-D-erythritol 4-phosphate cytidylyltransferase